MASILVAAVLLSLLSLCIAGSFENLCYEPLRFGKGVLKNDECDVTYPIDTVDKREALRICETNSPFDVKLYNNGFPTKCTYVKGYMCDEGEHLVNDRCFAIQKVGRFDQDGCWGGHTLHVISSMWELKWITILLGIDIREVWIHEKSKDYIEVSMSYRTGAANQGVKVRLQAGFSTSPGVVMYARSYEILHHLCSKPAVALDATVHQISETMKHLGFSGGVTTDNTGRQRAFSVVPLMLPVRLSNNTPDLMDLHKSCRLFPNGYAASLNDLKDIVGFVRFKRTLSPGAYRTTGGRMLYASAIPYTNCKVCEDCVKNRKYWSYVSAGNTQHPIPQLHWEKDHPRSFCADVPRTTLAMDSIYVDLPPIARRSVLCTYGNPPNLKPLNPNDQCNRAAHFDFNLKHCVCNDPKSDARVKDAKNYAHVPEGLICMDCEYTTNMTSIVFILDDSGSIGRSGWSKQENFVLQILKKVENARVGIVVLTGESYVAIPMDYYQKNKHKIKAWMDEKEWRNTYTGLGTALYEARTLLDAEKTEKKFIIMFTDGDNDWCEGSSQYETCTWEIQEKQRRHPLKQEADLIHERGYEVIYVRLPCISSWPASSLEPILESNANYVAKKKTNIMKAHNFEFTSEHLERITSRICRVEK